jgi:hypothetical protein
MVLEKVVGDLNLDKNTTITKEQNYTIHFKNLEDAKRFSEFLSKNGIKDDYEGDDVPILAEFQGQLMSPSYYISLKLRLEISSLLSVTSYRSKEHQSRDRKASGAV